MPFPRISPYDILEIDSSATQKEIIAAYQAAVRKKRFPIPQIAQAFNDLRNARKRAEHDLLTLSVPTNNEDIKRAFDAISLTGSAEELSEPRSRNFSNMDVQTVVLPCVDFWPEPYPEDLKMPKSGPANAELLLPNVPFPD